MSSPSGTAPVVVPQEGGVARSGARARVRRLVGPLGFAVSMVAAVGALYLRDPHIDGSWGKCPSLMFLGVACPLCGGLRAVNDLAHGDIGAAFWSNALFVCALPLFALWWVSVVRDRWRGSPRPWRWPLETRGVMVGIIVVLGAFSVLRNVPWGSAFYP